MSILTAKSCKHASLLAVASSALLIILAPGVQAGEGYPQRAVSYADLDLSQQNDARKLYSRLRAAATAVCRQYEGADLHNKKLQKQCYDEALARAVAEVNHAAVLALHHSNGAIRVAQKQSATAPRG